MVDAAATPPSSSVRGGARGRVLVADDEAPLREALARLLGFAGFTVDVAPDGRAALDALGRQAYDVVVSDISMPGLDGVGLLREVRTRDQEVPVVLMTGAPQLATAIAALRAGAFDYLEKPVESQRLVQVVSRANLLHRMARLKREALDLVNGGGLGLGDRTALEAGFDRALETMWVAYQPIVRAQDGGLLGYEALMRTEERTLPHPGAILDAAERLGRVVDIGRSMRALAPEPMGNTTAEALLFVNLHSTDLYDDALMSRATPLAAMAGRVVLEITERASLDVVPDIRGRVTRLREMGFRIAIDDLGAGYAGLTSFALLEPEFVKLDMSLVKDIDQHKTKQKLVRSIVALCGDLGMRVIGEGVETPAERDALVSLGCELLQGYLFAKPGRAFPPIVW